MIRLTKAVTAVGTPRFAAVLKQELEHLGERAMPLQQGLRQSGCVGSTPPTVTVLGMDEGGDPVRVRVGVFYTGVIGGCNCADDPSPVDELTEYCELDVRIDRRSGEAVITLRED